MDGLRPVQLRAVHALTFLGSIKCGRLMAARRQRQTEEVAMKLPRQAEPIMRKIGTMNHFGLGIRPAACPPGIENEIGSCHFDNGEVATRTNCYACCAIKHHVMGWQGPNTGLVFC